jgi:ribosome-associated protein
MRVSPQIVIDERDLDEQFVRASGPGGQNVNKVSTAVQLRFRAAACAALNPAIRARLFKLAGNRATTAGEIVIIAQRFRTQSQNRADARARLAALILNASLPPKLRRATKPTAGSKKRRLDSKQRTGNLKRLRSSVADHE